MRWAILAVVMVLLTACAAPGGGAPSTDGLRSKADAGDPVAMFTLGLQYDAGRDVARDKKEAARWYSRSAEAGFAEAQNSLGSMFQAGEGVEKDFTKARFWYEKAAAQGHAEATNNLAFLYDEGLGVPEDNRRAIELYTRAAEFGFAKSMVNLGIMHARGEGVPANKVEAFKWLDLARFYTQNLRDMQLKWQARGLLDDLRKTMSRDEIAAGEKLSRDWDAAHRTARR